MRSVRDVRMLLWLLPFLSLADGKGGGGGGDDGEEVSKVSISQDKARVDIGGTVTLTCSYPTISHAKTLFWFKKNNIVYANDKLEVTVEKSKVKAPAAQDFKGLREHKLILYDVQLSDEGMYKCLVSFARGDYEEGVFELVVDPDAVEVEEFDTTSLMCEDHIPSLPLVWWKDISFVAFNGSVLAPQPSGYALNGTTLIITNITSSYEGRYTCHSYGTRIHSWIVSIKRPVIVEESPLKGWKGILFGVALAVLIVGTLAIACFIQNRPFKENAL